MIKAEECVNSCFNCTIWVVMTKKRNWSTSVVSRANVNFDDYLVCKIFKDVSLTLWVPAVSSQVRFSLWEGDANSSVGNYLAWILVFKRRKKHDKTKYFLTILKFKPCVPICVQNVYCFSCKRVVPQVIFFWKKLRNTKPYKGRSTTRLKLWAFFVALKENA